MGRRRQHRQTDREESNIVSDFEELRLEVEQLKQDNADFRRMNEALLTQLAAAKKDHEQVMASSKKEHEEAMPRKTMSK